MCELYAGFRSRLRTAARQRTDCRSTANEPVGYVSHDAVCKMCAATGTGRPGWLRPLGSQAKGSPPKAELLLITHNDWNEATASHGLSKRIPFEMALRSESYPLWVNDLLEEEFRPFLEGLATRETPR